MQTRIRHIRKSQKLTQEQFAHILGLKRNTICRYERGDRAPSQLVINAICHAFGISENWFVYGSDDMYAPQPNPSENNSLFSPTLAGMLVRAIFDLTPEQIAAIKDKLTQP